ncbi:hypothetical protein Y032_0019g3875 [Ancylostoma ceylanicum]|nr:hypothetical protein Y032_0019g3875 [Ancylostoma ceylanicum]
MALKSKIPQDIEEERRGRSILISGLPESGPDTLLLKRKDELETNVAMVLETLKFDYWPAEMYRMEDAEIADEGADENLAPSEASTAGNDIHSDSVALEINDVDCGSIEGEQETEVVQIDAEKQLVATIQERSDSSKKELVPSFDTDGIEVEKLNICVLCDEVQPPLEEYEDEDVMEDALVLWWCCSNCKTWAHRDCMETRDCPVCDGIFEPTG